MEHKLLDKSDIALLEQFIDDNMTQYNSDQISDFLNSPNSFGFVLKTKQEMVLVSAISSSSQTAIRTSIFMQWILQSHIKAMDTVQN